MGSVGIGYIVLSGIFFSFAGALVKYLENLPFLQIVLCRTLVVLVMSVWALCRTGVSLWGRKGNRKILIYRGITGTLALSGFFYTLKGMSFANAITVQHLSPLFTMIISAFALGEPGRPLQWLMCLCAFVGMYIVYGGELANLDHLLVIGILSAICSAGSVNLIRYLRGKEHVYVVVLYFALVTIPLAGGFCLFNWVSPTLEQWGLLAVIGIFTQVGQYCLTMAYQLEKAEKLAIWGYLNVVMAFAIGWLMFGEAIALHHLLGVGIIIASLVISSRCSAWQFSFTPPIIRRNSRP
jgi:drug/metabolite transporter (DMT)-like permease